MDKIQSIPPGFTITINDTVYIIKPMGEIDCTYYEVSTDCEKIFTLKSSIDSNWSNIKGGFLHISEELFNNIAAGISKYESGL